MTNVPMWRRYLRISGLNVAADVDTEVAFHLDMRTQELIDKGWSPADARAEAVRCIRQPGRRHRRMSRRRRAASEAAAHQASTSVKSAST